MLSNYVTAVLSVMLPLTVVVVPQVHDLHSVAEWSETTYEFPSETIQNQTLASGEYVRGAGTLIDMDVDYGGRETPPRVFVTVPRFVSGIPITLGTVTNTSSPGGPLIRGYPNYTWNADQGRNCEGLTSVFRVAIDDCRRLWVIDNGKIANTNVQNCQPQLFVFDLDTDQVLRRYILPLDQYKIGSSLLTTLLVDVRDATPGTVTTCPNTFAYIGDVTGFGVIVYDLQRNRSWRAQNKYLYSTPHAGTHTIAGESFDLMDGIFGVSLSPPPDARLRGQLDVARKHRPHSHKPHRDKPSNRPPVSPAPRERLLYFHALASNFECTVPLRVLGNASMWEVNRESARGEFVEIGYRGTHSTAESMDSNGNLFIGLIDQIAIGCWDSTQPYSQRTIHVVAQNNATLQFSSGVKVKRNRTGGKELWISSNRYQKVADGTISPNETNFRVMWVEMERLVDGQSRCMGRTLV